jgi:hypothetical protein
MHTGASLPFQGTSFGMRYFIEQGTIQGTHTLKQVILKRSIENTILLNPVLSQRFQQVSHVF